LHLSSWPISLFPKSSSLHILKTPYHQTIFP
jgi:hypothetical protein